MMRLKNRDKAPPDFFRATHKETGHTSVGNNYYEWEEAIRKHRTSNNLPMPDDMMAVFESELCQQLDPEWCEHSENGNHVSTRFSLRQIADASKAYLSLFTKKILGSEDVVSQDEVDRRARLCASCFLLARPQGCSACSKVARFVTGAVGRMKSAYDSSLNGKACAVCLCPAKSIVHFPMSILEEHDTPEKQALYPSDFCWRSKASPNYRGVAESGFKHLSHKQGYTGSNPVAAT